MIVLNLPSGQRVQLDQNSGYKPYASQVVFTLPGGTTVTENLPSSGNATGLCGQLNQFFNQGFSGILHLNGAPAVLGLVVPAVFVCSNAGAVLSVYGTGFQNANLGTVYVLSSADALAGRFNNSFQYTVVMQSAVALQATYLQTNGAPSGPLVLVFVDRNGNVSNPLPVTASGASTGLSWININPSTGLVAGNPYSFVITGTGFLAAGILSIAFNNAGYYDVVTSVNSDTNITTGGAVLPAGVFPVYWTPDNVTFNLCGVLTVTAA